MRLQAALAKIGCGVSLLAGLAMSGQAVAEYKSAKAGTISPNVELIFFENYEDAMAVEHECPELQVPTFVRINKKTIRPACWLPHRGDGIAEVTVLDKPIVFNGRSIKYKKVRFDSDLSLLK
jgi:hypothetical protein